MFLSLMPTQSHLSITPSTCYNYLVHTLIWTGLIMAMRSTLVPHHQMLLSSSHPQCCCSRHMTVKLPYVFFYPRLPPLALNLTSHPIPGLLPHEKLSCWLCCILPQGQSVSSLPSRSSLSFSAKGHLVVPRTHTSMAQSRSCTFNLKSAPSCETVLLALLHATSRQLSLLPSCSSLWSLARGHLAVLRTRTSMAQSVCIFVLI